jgi:hypothetical protein
VDVRRSVSWWPLEDALNASLAMCGVRQTDAIGFKELSRLDQQLVAGVEIRVNRGS